MNKSAIKLDPLTKDTLIDLAIEYEIITPEDVDKFEKIYNEYDCNFINIKFNRCSWWSLFKDKQYTNDKYNKLIQKHEKLICERIKKRVEKSNNNNQ